VLEHACNVPQLLQSRAVNQIAIYLKVLLPKLLCMVHSAYQGRTGPHGCLVFVRGPVGPPATWAATLNVEIGQTTYPVNRGSVGMKGREESEGQSHKEKQRRE